MSDAPHQHFPSRTLRAYRDGLTPPPETLAVSDGLAACAACRAALAALDGGPGYELLAAAAEDSLAPAAREALAARLADDPLAATEFADLQAFRRELEEQPTREYAPTARPAPAAPAGKLVVVPWTKLRGIGVLAALAAVLLLLAAGRWLFPAAAPGARASLLTDRAGHRTDPAALPPEVRAALADILDHGRLPASPALAALRPPPDALAGATDAASFRVVSPVGRVVRDPRPTLRWTHQKEATGYVVTLLAAGDAGVPPVSSGELPASQTEWTPSAPLQTGAVYVWGVEAVRGPDTIDRAPRPPTPEALFQVLDDARRAALAQVAARYGDFPLIMAAALADAGLPDEAAAALDQLAREHPGSPLAQRLRREAAAANSIPGAAP